MKLGVMTVMSLEELPGSFEQTFGTVFEKRLGALSRGKLVLRSRLGLQEPKST